MNLNYWSILFYFTDGDSSVSSTGEDSEVKKKKNSPQLNMVLKKMNSINLHWKMEGII